MKLTVRVIEARNLPATDLNGLSDPYVRLQLGRQRSRTRVVKKTLNPKWGEDFSFRVEDLKEELTVSVLDEDRYFADDFVGQIKLPVSTVFDADNNSLPSAWYPLRPKSRKSKIQECGEILLDIHFSQRNSYVDFSSSGSISSPMRQLPDVTLGSPLRSFGNPSNPSSPVRQRDSISSKDDKSGSQKTLVGRIAQLFHKNQDPDSSTSTREIDSDVSETSVNEMDEGNHEEQSSHGNFDETLKIIESKDQGIEIPTNLPGGVLLDQLYAISPSELNVIQFSPDSSFLKDLADLQGTTELQMGSWKIENGGDSLKRVISYVKAATKFINAVKATEEQTYLKADGKAFAVLASVSTPDVIYGSTFRVEVLYCMTPGPELPSGRPSSRLVISWRMNFIQSTMMKGMIENGARQGLKDSYEQYARLLSQNVEPVDSKEVGSDKEQVLASLHAEPQSDWKLAVRYLGNFTVVSTVFMAIYAVVHIWLSNPNTIQGLEFEGLDMPDSIGEFIVCGILVLQGERVLELISRFMQARKLKTTDHGVKAKGDGWLLTVALIEGDNLAAVDSSGFSDPYVVFTCNGKKRTSSIKFQECAPQWNEIFEFDAMEEPPSVLDVEVFDFDGPFDEATSLGYAEINFVRTNIADLADIWVTLQGRLAQSCQSKLHLRVFLDDTREGNVVKDFLSRMEKEVGKKITLRSPHTNSGFQKLFGLPPQEFLINYFTCHLRRRMPLQGRLFLSARIVGFHTNLFGHKTTFSFLWEDIDDIQVVAPTLYSIGSPVMVMTLRKGRGLDARHGAKTQDDEGRLKFHLQFFVSFNIANRTIMTLWKSRSLSPEQKVQIVEQDSEAKMLSSEESGSLLDSDEVSLSEVFSSVLTAHTNFTMELFSGGEFERRVMEKAGCLNYSCTPWESEKSSVYERQLFYSFDKYVSLYRGEVTSSQQKSPLTDKRGWLVEEVLTLHGVPLGDFFNLHLKYQIEDISSTFDGCKVQVLCGIAWLKSTKHQKRITKNIVKYLNYRLKVVFSIVENEYASR